MSKLPKKLVYITYNAKLYFFIKKMIKNIINLYFLFINNSNSFFYINKELFAKYV